MTGKTTVRIVLSALLAVLAAEGTALAEPKAQPAPDANVVLTERHFWRKHFTFFTPRVSAASAKEAGIDADPAARARHLARFHYGGVQTPAPPPAWVGPDFDDTTWQIARGRQFIVGDKRLNSRMPSDYTSAWLRGNDPFVEEVGLVSQRGKFLVTDRARVGKLMLSLAYRGGFVAYLNGKEIARAHLPAGKIAPTIPATDYPLTAFFARDSLGGKSPVVLNSRTHKDSDQWEIRERKFGPKAIPLDALRNGVNVLAVELHRADYPAQCRIKNVKRRTARSLGWATVGLSLLTLQADGPAEAIRPQVPRSTGLQVWTRDIARAVGRRLRGRAPRGLRRDGRTRVRRLVARGARFRRRHRPCRRRRPSRPARGARPRRAAVSVGGTRSTCPTPDGLTAAGKAS